MNRRAGSCDELCQAARIDVDQHLDALYAYAFRLTGSREQAEELTQQAFLLAHEHLGQLRESDKVRPWLLRVLRNAFLKDCRKRRPYPASQLDLEMSQVAQVEANDSICDEEQIQRALQRLPVNHRTIVLMYFFESLSYREIAGQLQLPIGTVMSRLSRAKMQLRRLLMPSEELTP
jgi:RNA polymerase sigma-70 factor (ECF subfamily)